MTAAKIKSLTPAQEARLIEFREHKREGHVMAKAHEIYAASKPRVGDPITYNGKVTGKVHRVEDALCWTAYADGSDPLPFIWCFKDTLNTAHDWPTKEKSNA